MMDRNVIKVSCTDCSRVLDKTNDLVIASSKGRNIVCKDCRTPLEVTFGNLCADHYEDLRKGYCNKCAKDELMDNQL